MSTTTVEYFDEPTYIDTGDGFVFGPYGPGQCESVHPYAFGEGARCKHHANHVGTHASWERDTPAGAVKYRWA